MQNNHYDVIVIGVGSMGSATCWQLARQGAKVLGIEQFDIPHERGSYGGQCRIIRKAYFEHPDYVPLLLRAYQNWHQLEQATSAQIYHQTGIVYHGTSDDVVITGSKMAANLYDIPFQKRDKIDFPQFNTPGDFDTYFEPESGFLESEKAVTLYTQASIQLGAEIHTREKLLTWTAEKDRVVVQTDKGTYVAAKLIISAGAWAEKAMPTLKATLKVKQQTTAWVNPKVWKDFEMGNFPCWFVSDSELGMFYGFPILDVAKFGGNIGFKMGLHVPGSDLDPDNLTRNSTETDEKIITDFLKKYMPETKDALLSVKSCLYTYSEDEHFVIDFLPETHQNVIFACGFSGHGFKFTSVVGEILSDMALKGKTDLPADFLGLKRFLV